MSAPPVRVFDLPDRLAAKARPALLAADEHHFAAITASLAAAVEETRQQLAHAALDDARTGTGALERDQEVRRLRGRLRTLERHAVDLCLGRTVARDGTTTYLGRVGLRDADGTVLLLDWRTPAAEPFFAATPARPLGLASRRRYRWQRGRVVDFWDEVLDFDAAGDVAPDDQSAFIASLAAERTDRMRDVLGTLQADQDAIIRASSRGALVVDGGPGTGKTVVALHRAAFLTYADPRISDRAGGVLVVGPTHPWLAFVSDVLPGLGEEGVVTCTLADLVPEGDGAGPEADPRVAALKESAALVGAVEPAVALYEEAPTTVLEVSTPWGELRVLPGDWAEAFAAPDPDTPHNDARDEIWEALVEILHDRLADEEVAPAALRRVLARDGDLVDAFTRAWPVLDPTEVVEDMWSVPAYLRRCAPWLTEEEVQLLRREDPRAWTVADLPLLDAARRRVGDPDAGRQRRRAQAAREAEAADRAQVVEHLVATDDSEMKVMSMLKVHDLRAAFDAGSGRDVPTPDRLAGPFAHVVVDEAQELTDAQWQMLLTRCPTHSLTVVGDRAQARRGFAESWGERLARVGVDRARIAGLTINYRTPEEVMAVAAPVIRAALPDANVPTSIRRGAPVAYGRLGDLDAVLTAWTAEHAEGTACVIGGDGDGGHERVAHLTPELAKGLEFDLVVFVEPSRFGAGITGAVDTYVAMTRATRQLVVLEG